MMKICVIGGGHIGTALTCYIKYVHPEYQVNLLTRRPHLFDKQIVCHDWEGNKKYISEPDVISNAPEVCAHDVDVVFIALPHFAVEKAFSAIAPYVSSKAFIGVLPGGGGCEFFFRKYFSERQTLFGFQRVPFTAKLEVYGKEVNLKSWKPYSVVGTIPSDRVKRACELIESCGLKTKIAKNYLEIALTPTNPLLHTSRTSVLFGSHDAAYIYPVKPKFYVGWTDASSEILFAMDNELHALLNSIEDLETSAIRPLSEHYESPTISDLTRKINSIATFQSVYAPMKEVTEGYVVDVTSRMFTEDFPWGLALIRSYFDLFGVEAPTMDSVLKWYADFMGYEWFVDGKFCGKDLIKTGILQNYGILDRNELLTLYK